MKNARILNILSLVFNALLICVLLALAVLFPELQLTGSYRYVEVYALTIGSIFAGICMVFNIIYLIKNKQLPRIIYALKLISTASIIGAAAFVIVTTGLVNGNNFGVLFNDLGIKNPVLYLDIIAPAVALIGFLFFDHADKPKWPIVFLTIIPLALYAAGYIVNTITKVTEFDGSYDWYQLSLAGRFGPFIVWGITIGATFVLALILYLINRLLHKAFFRKKPEPYVGHGPYYNDDETGDDDDNNNHNRALDEPVQNEPLRNQELEDDKENVRNNVVVEEEVEEPVAEPEQEGNKDEPEDAEEPAPVEEKEEEPEAPKPVKKPASTPKKTTKKPAAGKKEVKEPEPAPANNGTKVYHLTKRKEDGMWAITFVGGKKPVKLFKTKKEAEEYLEVLTKNQGATALIRNSKGAKAGKFASSIKSDEDK